MTHRFQPLWRYLANHGGRFVIRPEYVELGVEGNGILWDIRLPDGLVLR